MELEYQTTKDMNATNASGLNLQNFKTNVRFFLFQSLPYLACTVAMRTH
jgi:hypothetical protein